MIFSLFLLSICGLTVCLYAFFVEKKIAQDRNYKPVCEISDKISCVKVMKSSYSKLFFISNALIGAGFYALMILLAICSCLTLIQYFSFAALCASIGLGYILYAKIQSACPVCISIYGINFLLFVFSNI